MKKLPEREAIEANGPYLGYLFYQFSMTMLPFLSGNHTIQYSIISFFF